MYSIAEYFIEHENSYLNHFIIFLENIVYFAKNHNKLRGVDNFCTNTKQSKTVYKTNIFTLFIINMDKNYLIN